MPRSPKSRKPSAQDRQPKQSGRAPSSHDSGSHAAAKQESKTTASRGSGGRIEIPLISTPNDQVELEREMEELFNEEKVKHRHGGTEPERD